MTTPPETSYREIPLTQGQVTIADAADYEWLSCYKWRAHRRPGTMIFYAVTNTKTVNGKRYRIYMHRLILGLGYGDKSEGDHRDPLKTLDNRRSNLRMADDSEQQRNKRKMKNNTTGFKGVYRTKNGKYRAQIKTDIGYLRLGYRDTAQAAHTELWVPAALKYHGEFARLA